MSALLSILSALLGLFVRKQRSEAAEEQQKDYDELQKKPANWFAKHFNGRLRSTDANQTTKADTQSDHDQK